MDPMILDSLKLMLYGLGGVFASLGILWGTVKIVSVIFPYKEPKKEED